MRRRREYPHAHEVPTSTDAGLEEAFRELEVRAVYEAGEHRRAMSAWSRAYFFVGLPAAVLAAIAGATALASTAGRIPAGIIALCASGLGAAAAFLDSETRRRTHEQLAAAWQTLADDVVRNILVDFVDEDWRAQRAGSVLDDHLARQRKLLQGRAPDETAEAERKAEMADFKGRMLASTIGAASTEPAPRADNEPESADNA